MDFPPKRPLDPTTPTTDPTGKRRHQPPDAAFSKPHPKPNDTVFRILCPASRTAHLIGKGGSAFRHLCDLTGARIRVLDEPLPSPSDERVILILGDSSIPNTNPDGADSGAPSNNESNGNGASSNATPTSSVPECEDGSQAQHALVRVFERMVRLDEDKESFYGSSSWNSSVGTGSDDGAVKGSVCCRLLAPSNQVGCVLGRGGKIVEKIRQDSGAQIRVLPRDQIPSCAFHGDELIQITGNFSAVKKALVSVSSCLQDNPRADAANFGSAKSPGMALHGTGMHAQGDLFPRRVHASGPHGGDYHWNPGHDNMGGNHRMFMEEEVVFKLLCQVDKVGSLIGKGGSIIRAMQSETGASIKISDAPPESDERVVVISARENVEQRHSPAQDAVMRVFCRLAEIGFESDAPIVARLLVHSQQIGHLLGKGGFIISEIRRATGAGLHVFPREQIQKSRSQSEEVVQVMGTLQSVQDALFHVTSRLRETIFPMKAPFLSMSAPAPPYLPPPFPEMPPPPFRPRHNPPSPGNYSSPVGLPHAINRSGIPSQRLDHQPAFSHGTDHITPSNLDRVRYPYGSERQGHGPAFDRSSSPKSWSQASNGNPRGNSDSTSGLTPRNGSHGSGQVPALTSPTVEVVIPQTLLSHVYGENNSNLSHIRQISGASVVVQDPNPGASEGLVVVSGTTEQKRAAQSLIHAFILCGQTAV